MRRPSPRRLFALLAALAACGPSAGPLSPQPPLPPEPSLFPAPVPPIAIAEDPAAVARIAADLKYLASPELAGRGTGEEGSKLAAELVAKRFKELGLAPMGSLDTQPSYHQPFNARVGVKVELASLVVPQGKPPKDPDAWTVADGSASGRVKAKAVLVGYGITAPGGWDDYAGANIEGKIAVILDGVPAVVEKPLRDYTSVRYKLRTAREHKAIGAVIVTGAAKLPGIEDATNMGLPAIIVKRSAANAIFRGSGLDDKATWEIQKPIKPRELAHKEVVVATRIEPIEAPSANVIGMLPGTPELGRFEEVVVVGGHYDHLGARESRFSMAKDRRGPHLGADDNASGTALVLEVARRLHDLPRRPARSVLFMAFGAEELGILGSRYWIEHPTVPLDRVVAMINADMVGRLRDDRLIVDGVASAAGWEPLVRGAAAGLRLNPVFGAESFGSSDHASFVAARIPVAFFFTGAHEDYHRPSDTFEKINVEGEARIATLAARLAAAVADAPGRLTFVAASADPHAGGRGGFKVSLGTIPDYGFTGKGVKLTGVRPDAPAARAGLAAGDVIVKLGTHEVTNIHDYMFALGELEAGREVAIEVLRGDKQVALKIIPAPGR